MGDFLKSDFSMKMADFRRKPAKKLNGRIINAAMREVHPQ